ncbi:LOW QUALITY PROTEIN: Alpha kinase, partial [Phytophthora palmivora]
MFFLRCRSKNSLRVVKEVAKDIRLKYAKPNTLELVIVMYCIGSMSLWIQEAKTAKISRVNNINCRRPHATVRVGFVAYRDFCDSDKRLQIQTLTTNVAVVQTFISLLEAFGGGDGPEDIPGGLAAALEMSFQAEARRIVLVGDAPCHGTRFHDSNDDNAYRVQIEQSPDICAQMREIAKRGIDFTFIEIQPSYTAKMMEILQEEFNNTESDDGFGREFKIVSLANAGDAARFASVIQSSASSSISTSMERNIVSSSKIAVEACRGHASEKISRPSNLFQVLEEDEEEGEEIVIVAPPEVKPLDWNELSNSPDIAAVRHSLHFKHDELVDWENLDLKHTQQETMIRLTRSCFAKGAMRSAHALYD